MTMSKLVPKGWTEEFLNDVFDKISNGTTANQITIKDGLPVTRIETIAHGFINFKKVGRISSSDADDRYLMKKGDILFSNINSVKHIGKVAYFNGEKPLFHGMNLLLFRADEAIVHSKFIFNLMQSNSFNLEISKRVKPAINQASISGGDLKEIKILCPPLPEQKKIAAILSSVDDVIENIQKQINKLQDLKKATMNELLTKGINHTEFKNSPLGKIPKSWEVVEMKTIGEFTKGKGISKNETVTSGIPCIRYAEIYTEYDVVIKKFKSFMPKKITSSSNRLKPNDIIFAGSGETIEGIGKSVAFLSDCEAYVGGDAIIFSPTIELDSLYFSYQLNSDLIRKQLRKLGQGSSIVHIYPSGLEKLLVSNPPFPEQKKISSILTSIDKNIETKTNKLNQTQSLKKSLMQNLLTGKVRVKI